ncbi:hypothetical protein ACROYT_G008930 [Oculina patagonica]
MTHKGTIMVATIEGVGMIATVHSDNAATGMASVTQKKHGATPAIHTLTAFNVVNMDWCVEKRTGFTVALDGKSSKRQIDKLRSIWTTISGHSSR